MAGLKKIGRSIQKGVKGVAKTIKKVEDVGKKVLKAPIIGEMIKSGWEEAKRADPRIAALSSTAKSISKAASTARTKDLKDIAKEQYEKKGRAMLKQSGVNVEEVEKAVGAVASGKMKEYSKEAGKRYIESNKPMLREMKTALEDKAMQQFSAVKSSMDQGIANFVEENPIVSAGIKPLIESTNVIPSATERVQGLRDLYRRRTAFLE